MLSAASPEFVLFPQSFGAFVSTGKVSWLAVPESGVADCLSFSTRDRSSRLFEQLEPKVGETEVEYDRVGVP